MSFQSGYYKIEARHSGKAMAVATALTTDGAMVVQWDWQNGDEQKFRITDLGDGYYRIEPKHSKKVVAIADASTWQGWRSIQFGWQNGDEQKFKITDIGDGYYKIEAKHSGQALAIGSGATHSGAGVIQWPYGGGHEQQWKFTCVEPLEPKGGIPWAVSLHLSEIAKDPTKAPGKDNPYSLERAAEAFRTIKDLGANMVRTDYNWFDIESEKGNWDEDKLKFFKDYTDLARGEGLSILCILFQPPEWAKGLPTKEICNYYHRYCLKVVQELKGKIDNFQLWNEPNHLFVKPIGDRSDEDYADLFLAGDKALREVLGNNYTSWINMNCNVLYWGDRLEGYFRSMNQKDNAHRVQIGIDHYPGTWAIGQWFDWTPLDALVNNFIANPNSACYNRRGAIMETGYTTPLNSALWVGHTEQAQNAWIYKHPASALTELYVKIHTYRAKLKADFISFCVWYQLYDRNTGYSGDIDCGAEANFGIRHTDRNAKLGYGNLRELIKGFSDGSLRVSSI